jgi:hypothetical protein
VRYGGGGEGCEEEEAQIVKKEVDILDLTDVKSRIDFS